MYVDAGSKISNCFPFICTIKISLILAPKRQRQAVSPLLNARPAWSTKRVWGQSEPNSEALSQETTSRVNIFMCVQVKPFFFCKWILWWHWPRDAAQRVVTWYMWDPRFNSHHYKEKAIISNCLDIWVQGERHSSGAWWQSVSSSVMMKHSQGNHRSAHSVSSRQLCRGPQVPERERHPVSPFQRPWKNSPARQNILCIWSCFHSMHIKVTAVCT